ncbi:MAG: glycosyltransferase, partial [Pseudomonadota bacterium]
ASARCRAPWLTNRRSRRWIDAVRARPLTAEIAYSSTMAPYIARSRGARARLVDFVDADSEKFAAYAARSRDPLARLYKREARLLGQAETEIANWADSAFAITDAEAALFNARAEICRPVRVWENGVDAAHFDPAAPFAAIRDPADIVFTGVMDYRPNVDAVLFFLDEVWPRVRKAAPDANFAVVGARPSSAIRKRDGIDGVRVTGRVACVRPWLKQAKLAVAPLRIARGLQNKVLEAMAMATPVVATPAAAAGLRLGADDILVREDPASMADAVAALLHDGHRRAALGAAARLRVLNDYGWADQLARFDAALDDALASSASSARASAA